MKIIILVLDAHADDAHADDAQSNTSKDRGHSDVTNDSAPASKRSFEEFDHHESNKKRAG